MTNKSDYRYFFQDNGGRSHIDTTGCPAVESTGEGLTAGKRPRSDEIPQGSNSKRNKAIIFQSMMDNVLSNNYKDNTPIDDENREHL
ncbi:hypothetical protein JCM33374_g861 [Metschnikowia sp. JCM 33374]|nr:hypothetical protein JCM33374_g861 [Metschnikowia sp. JCM 33374]